MEDREMIEMKVQGGWCDVCGDNKEWGFEVWDYEIPCRWFGKAIEYETSVFVCQRCVRQHDQIDVRLQESVARLIQEADRRRSAGLDQEADWLDDEAARRRYWIGRIKAPSDADWKALEVAKIEADFATEPPEAEVV